MNNPFKKNVFIILISVLFISGCETVDSHCQRIADNFSEGLECIRERYGQSFSPDSPVLKDLDQQLKCGEEISELVSQGKLTDKQAWHLFWRARNNAEAINSGQFVCIDLDYLHQVEEAVKERQRKRAHELAKTLNN